MKRYRIVHQNTDIEVPEGEFLVGRSVGCHLVLDDPSVSRVHAAIIKRGDSITVIDKGSRNGIKVNGVKSDDEVMLKDGDLVGIGHQFIRITAIGSSQDADASKGMTRCCSCGAWLESGEKECSACGAGPDDTMVYELTSANRNTLNLPPVGSAKRNGSSSVIESQPIVMMTGIATKTLRMGQTEEAQRLMTNVLRMTSARAETGKKLAEEEFEVISAALVSFVEVTRKAEHISQLFSFHRLQRRLLGREQVERLYDLVRVAGYRSCPELTRYLELLDDLSGVFSPGERFLHRRIQGLVKICS